MKRLDLELNESDERRMTNPSDDLKPTLFNIQEEMAALQLDPNLSLDSSFDRKLKVP
jgi:hypothetical protein